MVTAAVHLNIAVVYATTSRTLVVRFWTA